MLEREAAALLTHNHNIKEATVEVENTTKRDPLLHLLGAMGSPDTFITDMEKAGQGQLVNSDVLPAEAPWDLLEDLGFVAGEPVEGDDLFRRCTLPEGWTKVATDHDMWSKVLDERGVERVAVFYKAAFYDRKAFARLANPGYTMGSNILYGDEPVALPEQWGVLTDAEREDFWSAVDGMSKNITDHPDIYGKYAPRLTALLALR